MHSINFSMLPAYLSRAAWPAILLALSGCAVGPDFAVPKPIVHDGVFDKAATTLPSTTTDATFDPAWWQQFDDATLVALETEAIAANLDLQAAAARLEQGRAALQISGAALLPRVDASASRLRSRNSENGPLAALGAPTTPTDLSQYGFDASWEIDLWGRVRRAREAAAAQADVALYDAQAMRVSLTAEVARTYLELRGVQSDLHIARASIDIAHKSLHVAERRHQQGVATQFDTSISAAQVATFEAAIPALEQRRAALTNALALLLAQPPHALDARLAASDKDAVPALPAQVPVGLPSQLAHRRPDILRAEAQLHAATASIGVAKAAFYPSVSLTGSFGMQAFRTADVGDWGSRQFSIGPVLHLPIFEGGRLKGNLALTEARQQEAAIAYQRTVLGAWHEVDNALSAYRTTQQRAERLDVAVTSNRQALASADRRYGQGAADYLNVLVTQQRLLDSENAASRSRTDMALAMVALYKALGGGWDAAAAAQ